MTVLPAPGPSPAATGDPPMVELRGLVKSFGAQRVLRGVNASFPTGKTTVVLGPSGSGKSVILKHIAVLMRPDSGEVRFQGKRIDGLSEAELVPVRREIGYLFQQSALFDSMTVAENLEFPLIEHTKLSKAERRDRVAEALATVDLPGTEGKLPSELSGGMQKRVALARAIILRPALILYDEPTTGLDPMRADGISNLILKLQRTLGATGVVVTHDLVCMHKVADKAVMIDEGVIVYDGAPSGLERSEDARVRRFVAGISEDGPEALSNGIGNGQNGRIGRGA